MTWKTKNIGLLPRDKKEKQCAKHVIEDWGTQFGRTPRRHITHTSLHRRRFPTTATSPVAATKRLTARSKSSWPSSRKQDEDEDVQGIRSVLATRTSGSLALSRRVILRLNLSHFSLWTMHTSRHSVVSQKVSFEPTVLIFLPYVRCFFAGSWPHHSPPQGQTTNSCWTHLQWLCVIVIVISIKKKLHVQRATCVANLHNFVASAAFKTMAHCWGGRPKYPTSLSTPCPHGIHPRWFF